MSKVAVLLAEGFEEIEALGTADILRRARVQCDLVAVRDGGGGRDKEVSGGVKVTGEAMGGGMEKLVKGTHGVKVEADVAMSEVERESYDVVVLPGGLPGADNLRDDANVIKWVQDFAQDEKKYVAAICAGPQVLAKAGVVRGRKVTAYPAEVYRQIMVEAGAEYVNERVVADGRIVTSQGPGTSFEFAYKLVEVLGGEVEGLKAGMLYR